MPRYVVCLATTASTTVVVDAEDEDAAAESALEGDMPTLCAHCSGWNQPHNLELNDVWDVEKEGVWLDEDEEDADDGE